MWATDIVILHMLVGVLLFIAVWVIAFSCYHKGYYDAVLHRNENPDNEDIPEERQVQDDDSL